MSHEQNEEIINQQQNNQEKEQNQLDKNEENKLLIGNNYFEQFKNNFSSETQNREFLSKFKSDYKDTYDDIKINKKENIENTYSNYQNQSNFTNNQTKNDYFPNYSQSQYVNNFSKFSNSNPNTESNNNDNNQLKSNFSDLNTANTINNNSNTDVNNNCNKNQIQNNSVASNYWKMRFSMNSSLYQRIMREDENLIQEHVYNQKKKDTLNVSNYKNIDIDITFKNQKIQERSEFSYFSDISDLDSTLKSNLSILNFTLMTPIQREVIKFIRNGNDVMGCSQTGTGKTIAFLLPIISRILNEIPSPLNSNPPSPRLLILIPTRELAEQIFTEARKIVNKTGIIVNKIYGGVPHDEQLEKMYSGCDILVATPGRLLDFIEKKNLSLKNVKYLIMDEADRMLDMGFQPQLMKIAFGCDLMPKNFRQNLLFSATFTEEIKNISKNFMNEDYYFIKTIFDKNPSKNIKQELFYAAESEKIDKLHEILKSTSGSIIIFVETKFGVDNLYLALKKYGHRVSCIHGDKKQQQRQEAIKRFSMGQISILIATDIASRGLDFPKVTHVINFDLPTNIEDYIHRIGRTGRCGNTGTAISFVNEYNKPIIKNLYYFMKKNHQKINDWFENLSKNCKDINVNIFDRIPKKPKRSLGLHNKTGGNDFNNPNFSQTNNYMQNRAMNNPHFSNSNMNFSNHNFSNYTNNPANFSNFNNFSNAFPGNSFDKTANQTEVNSNYEKKEKYETKRESSSSRNETGNTESYKKFSGSTSYNPDSEYKSNNSYDKHSREYNRDSSKEYKSNRDSHRDYNKDYNRDSSKDYNKDSSKDYKRDYNIKYESNRDNKYDDKKDSKYDNKSNDYNKSYSSSNKYSSYDNQDRQSNSRYGNSSNNQFLGKKHSYPDSSNKDEESSYQKNRRSRFDENNYKNENKDRSDFYNNRNKDNKYREKNDDVNKGSNFSNMNKTSNFSSNVSGGNDFSSNPNYMNSRDNTKRLDSNKDNSVMSHQNQNSMYSQYPGMPLNYMYPQMAYANYLAQNKANFNNTNSINSLNKNSTESSNYVNDNSNKNQNETNESTNTASTSKATSNTANPYSAYYNYAAYGYGFGANMTGYDPYNGQVYDYKYGFNYQGTDNTANSNKKPENKTNEQ